MTQAQRRWHLTLWMIIGPAAMLVLVAAALARRPMPVQPAVAVNSPFSETQSP